MVSYVQSLLANFVSAYYRITTWPPQKKKKISFFLFPAPLGQICFVLVLISPNHKARNRYPGMVLARTGEETESPQFLMNILGLLTVDDINLSTVNHVKVQKFL